MKKYAIGLDYGTLSVRALLLDLESGTEMAECVYEYPHGVLDRALPDGTALPADWALQVPADYWQGLITTVRSVMERSGIAKEEIAGIGLDFTSSTVLSTDENAVPLCEKPEYTSNPYSYCMLWKHHGAEIYAEEIDRVARERQEAWLPLYGGRISSEWMIPKIMQILREAPEVYRSSAYILEAGEWITWRLTGTQSRSACQAGYKAFYRPGKGYPDREFFRALDPELENLTETKLNAPVLPVGGMAGTLSAETAELLGLCPGIPVATPIIDAYASVPTSAVHEANQMMIAIGTSSVHILLSEEEVAVAGICGVVKDGVIPGLYSYEAGQCCVGDSFSWFVHNCVPESYEIEAREKNMNIHRLLREKAAALRPGESGLLALDWFNGCRNPWIDYLLSGTIIGMTIATRPEEIYRALLESTAFGTRTIMELFTAKGLPVEKICAAGGIPAKDPLLMQIYADVCNREIAVASSGQSGAYGSAIYAAAAAGMGTVSELTARLGRLSGVVYRPIPENVARYELLYREFCRLSEYLAKDGVMHRLRAMR